MGRLRAADLTAGAGGAALLASLFLHWYRRPPGEVTGWQAFAVLDLVLAALALVPLALVVLQATRTSPALPVAFSVLSVVAGALAALLVALRLAFPPDAAGRELGAWLALLAALVLLAGAWRSLRVEAVPNVPAAPVEDLRL